MFKPFVLTIATVALLGLSASALADDDDRHRRNHSGGHYGGHYGPPHGYGPPGHRGYGEHHGRRHHDDGLSDGVKIAAGALVLGTIVYAISQNQRQAVHTSQSAPPPGYWYRIDGAGDCVEVRLNSRAQEVWTYVDPAYCR